MKVASISEKAPSIKKVNDLVGAELRGLDLSVVPDEASANMLRQLLNEHVVLFFPDQHLEPSAQLLLAKTLGRPVIPQPADEKCLEDQGMPEVIVAGGAGIKPQAGQSANAEDPGWHVDGSWYESPPAYSILNTVEAHGGEGLWSNQRLAFASLSPKMQAMIGQLRALHVRGNGVERRAEYHPLRFEHQSTKTPSLFASSRRVESIEGLSDSETRGLMDLLVMLSVETGAICRRTWQEGELVIWDNHASMHGALFHEGDRPGQALRVEVQV